MANDVSHILALRASLAVAVHSHLRSLSHDRWLRCTPLMVLLIAVYAKLARLSECDALFAQCVRNGGREYARFETLSLREPFNAIIDAHGSNGDIARAQELARTQTPPNIATFVILLKSCARTGDVRAAERIFRNIGDDAVRFNVHVLSTLVDCFARAGRLCNFPFYFT